MTAVELPPALTEQDTPELSDTERGMLTWLRMLAVTNRGNALALDVEAVPWRYHGIAALLLHHGRLFSPGELPSEFAYGESGKCFATSRAMADDHGVVYVEGIATPDRTVWMDIKHAWCARPGESTALDPTWSPPGSAYIGVPYHDKFRREIQLDTPMSGILFSGHRIRGWFLKWGLPPDSVRDDVGRPIPEAARLPELTGTP